MQSLITSKYQTTIPKAYRGIMMPIDEIKGSVKWICCACPNEKHRNHIKDFIKYVDNRINIHIVNKNKWNLWTKWLTAAGPGTKVITPGIPQTGTAALFDLLQYDIAKLYVTGITFLQTRAKDRTMYYPGYLSGKGRPNLKNTKHHCRQEFKYFRGLCKKDKRIKCDKMLRKLINK